MISIGWLLVFCFQDGRAREPGPAAPPAVAMWMAKASYVQGEPIGIILSITNPGPRDTEFSFIYPLSFAREGFEGNELRFPASAPRLAPLPKREFIYSVAGGPHPLAAGAAWSATVFLQEHLEPPRPGHYRVEYRIVLPYRLADPTRDALNDGDEYPLRLSGRGTLAFDVRPGGAEALRPILEGYLQQITDADSLTDEGQQRITEAIEALCLVEDPIVIPYLIRTLDAGPVAEKQFQALERFRGHAEARRAVIEVVRSGSPPDAVSRALEWLAEGQVPLAVDDLRALLRKDLEKGTDLGGVLRYLKSVPRDEYARLCPEVTACLRRDDPEAITTTATALVLLARWRCPSTPEVQAALRRAAASLRSQRLSEVAAVLEALASWDHPPEAEALGTILDRRRGFLDVDQVAVLDYLRAAPPAAYRGLRPQLSAVLKSADAAESHIVLALEVLKHWGENLTAEERDALLKRNDQGRDEALKFMQRPK